MPLSSAGAGKFAWWFKQSKCDALKRMFPLVSACVDALKVANVVIKRVAVLVVNLVACGNLAVMKLPNRSVKV